MDGERESRVDRMIEEEKNRVLDFDPQDRARYVKGHVDQIIAKKKKRGAHMEDIKMEHFDFYDKYPKLFDSLFKPDIDMRQIDYMIHMLGSIGSRGRTLHDASRAVGQQLADRYVNSVVGKK
jgi:hypothetical protein